MAGNVWGELVGHWKLDDGAGSTAIDSSGRGRNGTVGGPANWVAGKSGGALDLNGTSNYVGVTSEIVRGTCSVALWMMPHTLPFTSGYRAIMHNDVWNTGSLHGHVRVTTSLANFDINGGGGVTSTTALQSNTWYHIVGTFDTQRGESKIYVNGKLEATATGLSSALYVGPLNFGAWTNNQRFFDGIMDDIRIYSHVLSEAEIRGIIEGDVALSSAPRPADKATDVPRDVILGWKAGKYAAKHDVYFGTNFADVNSASRTNTKSILVGQNQDANTYDPVGLLELGKTYYWRIDEVNAPPTSTVFKGNVWSFTTEPVAYPIKNITATASSFWNADTSPQKAVNGSGLNAGDQHSVAMTDMWLSSATGPQPTWIQFEFDRIYKLHEMLVWNYNQTVEPYVGFGFKSVKIEYSTDGVNWTQLTGVPDFAQGTGLPNYAANTTANLAGVIAKYVKITANSNYGILKQYGLSEVRFLHIPLQAREPAPTTGQIDVAWDTILGWRAGREAATHKLYISTSKKAVRDGTVAPVSIPASGSYAGHGPLALELGKTYFWRVDEVNEAKSPSNWQGEIWSFTTRGYVSVDNFEDYNDSSPKRIFQTWIDGFGYSEPAPGSPGNGSGSTVGNLNAPFAETRVGYTHSGRQAMPMDYNDAKPPYYSEAERTFATPQDWTTLGVKALTVWFRGIPGSTGSASYNQATDTYTIRGSGTDIWGAADQFHFAYKQLTGDGSIIARIDSITNTNDWAKAGVMIRETLDANSPLVDMAISYTNRAVLQWRTAKGVNMSSPDSSSHTVVNSFTLPRWVKLTRTGNVFTAQHSADGVNWIDVVPETAGDPTYTTVVMGPTVYIGLAVTSHDPAATCEAKISKVTVSGAVTPAGAFTTSRDIGIASNAREPLYVAITDSTGKTKAVTDPDPNAVLSSTYQEWNISLKTFSDAGVNLKSVKKLSLGTGNKTSPTPGGAGELYFDDIRLYAPRCVPMVLNPVGDVTSDCAVDYADIDVLADQWLRTVTPPATLSADLTTDNKVDLKDFSKLAQNWLAELLWP